MMNSAADMRRRNLGMREKFSDFDSGHTKKSAVGEVGSDAVTPFTDVSALIAADVVRR